MGAAGAPGWGSGGEPNLGSKINELEGLDVGGICEGDRLELSERGRGSVAGHQRLVVGRLSSRWALRQGAGVTALVVLVANVPVARLWVSWDGRGGSLRPEAVPGSDPEQEGIESADSRNVQIRLGDECHVDAGTDVRLEDNSSLWYRRQRASQYG